MWYFFWIINYKESDICKETNSNFLVKLYKKNLSKLLQIRSKPFTHSLNWKITEKYDNILSIRENATNLAWIDTDDDYSMAYTAFDTTDKTTDKMSECIWILITATDGTINHNGLIHIPAYQLKESWYDDILDQGEYIFRKYKNEIEGKWLTFTWCYYWWWLIPDSTHWLYDRYKKDYENATTKLMLLWYQFFKEYPYRISWPKWQWEECIIVETQKNRGHILRPDDDITISRQSF